MLRDLCPKRIVWTALIPVAEVDDMSQQPKLCSCKAFACEMLFHYSILFGALMCKCHVKRRRNWCERCQ